MVIRLSSKWPDIYWIPGIFRDNVSYILECLEYTHTHMEQYCVYVCVCVYKTIA